MAQQRMIDLLTPLGDRKLLFERMTGTETLGRSFEYEIYALSKEHDLSFDALLGYHGTLKIRAAGRRRVLPRCARGAVRAGRHVRDDILGYRIVARPWTWILTRTRDFLMRL